MTQVGIFPASGGIGGGTVKHILDRLPIKDLTFVARSPERLEDSKSNALLERLFGKLTMTTPLLWNMLSTVSTCSS
jgi:hypothetical protein